MEVFSWHPNDLLVFLPSLVRSVLCSWCSFTEEQEGFIALSCIWQPDWLVEHLLSHTSHTGSWERHLQSKAQNQFHFYARKAFKSSELGEPQNWQTQKRRGENQSRLTVSMKCCPWDSLLHRHSAMRQTSGSICNLECVSSPIKCDHVQLFLEKVGLWVTAIIWI